MQFSTAFIAAVAASFVGLSGAAVIPDNGGRYMVPECFEPCFQQVEATTECKQEDQQCRCESPFYQYSMVQCLSATCPTEQDWLLAIKLAFAHCDGLGLPMDYDNRAEFRGHLRNMPGFGTASSSVSVSKKLTTRTVASGTATLPVPTNGTAMGPGDGPNANSTIAAPAPEYTGSESDF